MEVSHKHKMVAKRPQRSYPQKPIFHRNPSFRQVASSLPKTLTLAPCLSGSNLHTPRPTSQSTATNPATNLHYFSCGEKSHFAKRCPHCQISLMKFNLGAPLARSQASMPSKGYQTLQPTRVASTPKQGHVNYIMTEEAQEAIRLLMDTFSVKSAPAHVFFDSGASYSFISWKFVDTGCPIFTM